jgi:hypothetical protein
MQQAKERRTVQRGDLGFTAVLGEPVAEAGKTGSTNTYIPKNITTSHVRPHMMPSQASGAYCRTYAAVRAAPTRACSTVSSRVSPAVASASRLSIFFF